MNAVRITTLASLILAAPTLALAQGKTKPPHVPAHVVVTKPAVAHADKDAARDAAEAARKANNAADKVADKSEKTGEKSENSALWLAHDNKLLTKGIKLTSSEETQIKAIEKNYDAQYRTLRESEKKADNTAKKTGAVDSDAAFNAQLSTLQTNERAALRATLTTQQQSIFDSNVLKLGTKK